MPIYDYQCECGNTFEAIAEIDQQRLPCSCGKKAKRIISASGVNCANEDADWIKSVAEVVNKNSENPYTQEFLKHPNRTNLRRHLSSSGLRHAEPGESFKPPPPVDTRRHAERLFRERQRKNRVEVR